MQSRSKVTLGSENFSNKRKVTAKVVCQQSNNLVLF